MSDISWITAEKKSKLDVIRMLFLFLLIHLKLEKITLYNIAYSVISAAILNGSNQNISTERSGNERTSPEL